MAIMIRPTIQLILAVTLVLKKKIKMKTMLVKKERKGMPTHIIKHRKKNLKQRISIKMKFYGQFNFHRSVFEKNQNLISFLYKRNMNIYYFLIQLSRNPIEIKLVT